MHSISAPISAPSKCLQQNCIGLTKQREPIVDLPPNSCLIANCHTAAAAETTNCSRLPHITTQPDSSCPSLRWKRNSKFRTAKLLILREIFVFFYQLRHAILKVQCHKLLTILFNNNKTYTVYKSSRFFVVKIGKSYIHTVWSGIVQV